MTGETLVQTFVAIVLTAPMLWLVSAIIGAAFVYFGWNGCHDVIGYRAITFKESFFLCMLARAVLSVTNTPKP